MLTPTFSLSGFALASSINSFTEFTGTLMLASSTEGTSATWRDRLEVLEWIVAELGIEERVHHQGAVDGEQKRVAVGLGLGDRLRADDGVGARPVVDDDLLAEVLAHLLADQAAEHVGRTARRERHDQGDRAGGVGLRRARVGQRPQWRVRQSMQTTSSWSPPDEYLLSVIAGLVPAIPLRMAQCDAMGGSKPCVSSSSPSAGRAAASA